MRQVLLVLALLGNPGLGGSAHADEDKNAAEFNELNRTGTAAYEKHDFKTAIRDFQQAYALKPEPLLFFNIAQCYRKINHDAEAITFYQSYLRRPETTDPELRAKAERYLTELRGRHTAQPQLIYVESTHAPRPLWRIGLGAGLMAASTLFLGFGGRALALNGGCVDAVTGPQVKCTTVLDTGALGTGLVVAGAVFAIGGAVTIAIPGRHQEVQRPASPTPDSQPGVVKPLASVLPATPLGQGNAAWGF